MGWFRRKRTEGDHQGADPSSVPGPESAIANLDLAEILGGGTELRQAINARKAALDEAERHYAERFAGQDPQTARDLVFNETGDHQVANIVAYRLRVDSWQGLSNDQFERMADEAMTEKNPMDVDYEQTMVALDVERDRRGLPLPPPLLDLSGALLDENRDLADLDNRAQAAHVIFWRLNSRLATFDASDDEYLDHAQANAEKSRTWRLGDPDEWDRYGRRIREKD